MIYIKISDMDFYDDAVVLIKSFYPRTEVMQYQEQVEQTRTAQDIVIEPEVPEKTGVPRKNSTKRLNVHCIQSYLHS